MAKTASLNATNRPGARCTEGESCPALPPGARAVSSERTQWITEAIHGQLVGDGITGTSSYEGRSPDCGGWLAILSQGRPADEGSGWSRGCTIWSRLAVLITHIRSLTVTVYYGCDSGQRGLNLGVRRSRHLPLRRRPVP